MTKIKPVNSTKVNFTILFYLLARIFTTLTRIFTSLFSYKTRTEWSDTNHCFLGLLLHFFQMFQSELFGRTSVLFTEHFKESDLIGEP